MVDIETAKQFIENALVHEYDPVKAHAYYIRNRELKGRKAAAAGKTPELNRKQRITALATKVSSKMSPEQQAKVTMIATQTKTQLTKLGDEFRAWIEKASASSKAEHEKVSKETQSKIAALPKLPANASAKQKEAHAAQVAKINKEGASKSAALDKKTKAAYKAKADEIHGKKDKVLKAAKASVRSVVGGSANATPSSQNKTAPPRR